MKQATIVAGRYYRSRASGNTRLVLSIASAKKRATIVQWCAVDYIGRVHHYKTQPLVSFARWADEEVRPIFDAVVRCSCGGWDWTDHAELFGVCPECRSPWAHLQGDGA